MTDDDELVERVARAICIAEGLDPDARVRSTETMSLTCIGREWNDSEDLGPEWEQFTFIARAAIAAHNTAAEKRGMLRAAEIAQDWDACFPSPDVIANDQGVGYAKGRRRGAADAIDAIATVIRAEAEKLT